MDLFVFAICVMLMIISMQYHLYWFILILAGVVIYVAKDMQTFIIISALTFILYIVNGTPYEQYSIYIAASGIVIYMILNRNEAEGSEAGGGFNPNDQYADLLKGLGG